VLYKGVDDHHIKKRVLRKWSDALPEHISRIHRVEVTAIYPPGESLWLWVNEQDSLGTCSATAHLLPCQHNFSTPTKPAGAL